TVTLDASSTGCSLSGGVVSFTAAGTCKVDANQGGNSTYNPASQQQQPITVAKKSQTVSFTSTNPSPVTVGATYTPAAIPSAVLPVAVSLDASSTGCSLSGGVVSFTAAGTCKVDADQAGDNTYNPAAQRQQSIIVNKKSQSISFTSANPSP